MGVVANKISQHNKLHFLQVLREALELKEKEVERV